MDSKIDIQKPVISFWQLNKRKVIIWTLLSNAAFVCAFYFLVTKPARIDKFHLYIYMFSYVNFINLISFFYPALNSFIVIKRLINDHSDRTILTLFDSGYVIGTRNKTSWLNYTIPVIKATISGLPVSIYFCRSRSSKWSTVTFQFSPLTQNGSKRIFSDRISFTMYLVKRLGQDVKPVILEKVEEIKKRGLTSGAERRISTKHFDAYEE